MFLYLSKKVFTFFSLINFKIVFKLVFIACSMTVYISLVNVCFPPIVASPADSALMSIYRDCIAQGLIYLIDFIHSQSALFFPTLDFTGSDDFDSDLDSIPNLLPHDRVTDQVPDQPNFRLGWSAFVATLLVIIIISSKSI